MRRPPRPPSRGSWPRGLHRSRRRPLAVALATGLLAFAIGAAVLTGSELVLGDSSVGSGGERTTVFGGATGDAPATDEQAPATTEKAPPASTPTGTAPESTSPQPPSTTTPPAPAPPAQTAPPATEQPTPPAAGTGTTGP